MRRGLAVLVLGLTAACSPVETTPDSDWWSYRKDAAESSRYAGDDVHVPLANVWERTFSDGTFHRMGSPVFGPGRVYVVLNAIAGPQGSAYGTSELLALRLTDGHTDWSFAPTGADVASASMQGPPVVSNGRIYAAFQIRFAGTTRSTVRVVALKPDGTADWTVDITPDVQTTGGMTAANGLLLFCTKGSGRHLHALHLDTGQEAWRADLGNQQFTGVIPPITPVVFSPINEPSLILLSTVDDLRALSFDPPGAQAWRYTFPRPGWNSTPIVFKWSPHNDPPDILVSVVRPSTAGDAFVADIHRLIQSGRPRQTLQFPIAVNPELFGRQSHLVAWGVGIGHSPDAALLAGTSVQALSGWVAINPDPLPLLLQSAPAVTSEVLFYTDSTRLHALSLADGSHVWSDDTAGSGSSHSQMLIGGVGIDQGFVVSADGSRIRAFRSAQ